MSFVAAATSVGAWALGTGAAAGIGSTIVGGALIGAGVGGAYSALTGDGKILDSMLTGAGVGGLAGGVGGAFFPGAAGYAAPASGIGAASNVPAVGAYANPGISTSQQVANFANASSDPIGALAESGALSGGAGQTGITAANTGLTAKEMLGYGLGATTLMGLLGGQQEGIATQGNKGNIRPYEYTASKREPAAGESYYFQPIEYDRYGKATKPLDTAERNYFDQKFTALPTYAAANGGQIPQLNNMPAGGLAAIQGMRDGYAPMTTFDGDIPQFSAGGINMQDGGFVVPADTVSHFGNGSTDAGLKLLGSRLGAKPIKGRGDGMSDSISAMINGKQPARIADGEAYVPPEMVKKIGKGSSETGAKRLYKMMDKVRHARTGTKKQGKQIKADKYLPT
jgi:hypothetical protein